MRKPKNALCMLARSIVTAIFIASLFLTAVAANAAGTLWVSLIRVPSCSTCADWQLDLYDDGSTRFIGREGVRLLGENGTVFSPSYLGLLIYKANSKPGDIMYNYVPDWIKQARKDVKKLREDALASLPSQSESSGASTGEPFEVRVLQDDGRWLVRRMNWTEGSNIEPKGIVNRIKDLYYSPADWSPGPAFLKQPDGAFYFSYNWLNGKNQKCNFPSAEYQIAIFRGGRVEIRGRAYDDGERRTPLVKKTLQIDAQRVARVSDAFFSIRKSVENYAVRGNAPDTGSQYVSRLDGVHRPIHYSMLGGHPNYYPGHLEFSNILWGYGRSKESVPSAVDDALALSRELTKEIGTVPPEITAFCASQPQRID